MRRHVIGNRFAAGVMGVVIGGGLAWGGPPNQSEWAWIGDDGTLEYQPTELGARIPDFSHAGYMGGGQPIPDVPVAVEVSPGEGDDAQRIQNAIDQVANMPLNDDGFRGAVLLRAGQYDVAERLNIRDSGIVLRGEGQHAEGTILNATGRPGDRSSRLVDINGSGSWQEQSNTRTEVTDAYVPGGTNQIGVEDASHFEVGDSIIVERRVNDQWVNDIGMNQVPDRADGRPTDQWNADHYDYRYDRRITSIDGNQITIDAPMGDAINEKYGGGSVYRYEFPGRISNVGIENMRAVSDYTGDSRMEDGDHVATFARIDRAENAWVDRVTSYHFGFGHTRVERRAKHVTVQDSEIMDPASSIGGSRRYGVYLTGQLNLVQRVTANEDRHAFAFNARAAGPNVFLDSQAYESHNDAGPHHAWATAGLMDNVSVPDHSIRVQNRLHMGNAHGWAGNNFVVWNSQAGYGTVHSPEIGQNWMIGFQGRKEYPTFHPDGHGNWEGFTDDDWLEENWDGQHPPQWGFDEHGDRYWDSHGDPVDPQSLYLQQLRDRLGDQAVDNVRGDHKGHIILTTGQGRTRWVQGLRNMLTWNGYRVTVTEEYADRELSEQHIRELEAADLVWKSRGAHPGQYDDPAWAELEVPMIISSQFLTNNWGWTEGHETGSAETRFTVADNEHAILEAMELEAGEIFEWRDNEFAVTSVEGTQTGEILLTHGDEDVPVLITWGEGDLGDNEHHRTYLNFNFEKYLDWKNEEGTWDIFATNMDLLTPQGAEVMFQSVQWTIPEPGTLGLLGVGSLPFLLRGRSWPAAGSR